jgi:hypothetical protein
VALIGRREEETLEGGFGHSLGLILRNLRRRVDSVRVRVNPNRFNFGRIPPQPTRVFNKCLSSHLFPPLLSNKICTELTPVWRNRK